MRSLLKITVCFLWIIFVLAMLLQKNWSVSGQTNSKISFSNLSSIATKIDLLDSVIQKRFLTEPSFGGARITPKEPTNPHFSQFYPKDDEERKAVKNFDEEKYKVSLYLFGRRTEPILVQGKTQKKFSINYRMFNPIGITKNVKRRNLPLPTKLLSHIKKAFIEFQTPESVNENNYEFTLGKWSYVARPVRAVNQTCISCHTDFVITKKLPNGKFTFRKRKIGDANGVIVYGFRKIE